jgi:predicted Ser/Thr protein kinase
MTPQQSIGHYRLTTKLGEGGMGAVYRATDSKLGRDVAIKVLPDVFAKDPDRMARFQREAQVLASLNHPHIATIYGVEDRALVMELVEGETLAERIARGPVPWRDALPLARQIVEALEAAHEKGIVHRDLKPANVKTTPNDDVKVLDFGLAKICETTRLSSDPAASPTMTIEQTGVGILLGTAAYMAPEQARGLAVDKRADVWSFGCLLYELLSGKAAFAGASTTDILAAVVRADPDWSALPKDTPAPIVRLLKRCLEKDRKRRLPEIGVARLEIDDALAASAEATRADAPRAASPQRRGVPAWMAAAVALALAAGWAWQARRAPVEEVWTGTMLGGPAKSFEPRLSPDGQLLAFLAFEEELPQLGVMKPNGGSWTILTHDREHGYVTSVSWAPDGSKIYFDRMTNHPMGVYAVPPLGGEPRLLLENASGPEALPDGSLLVQKLTEKGDQQAFHYWPESGKLEALPVFLPESDTTSMLRAFPDGGDLVFYGMSEQERSRAPRMLVYNMASRQVRELSAGLKIAAWSPLDVAPDGKSAYLTTQERDSMHLLEIPRESGGKPRVVTSFPASARPLAVDAARDGSLYTDLYQTRTAAVRLNLAGGAEEEVEINSMNLAVAPGGDVLVSQPGGGNQRLVLLHAGSAPRVLVESNENASVPATIFGGNVAFQIGTGDAQRIALASLRDGHLVRRFAARSDAGMSASPDGGTLYYSFGGGIWAQPVAGGDPRRITDGVDVTLDPAGKFLYIKRITDGVVGLARMPAGGGAVEEVPVPAGYHIADTSLSPAAVDGRGRILVTVVLDHSFYYHTAILDPALKSFTLVPHADGDLARAGWASDGRIVALGERYAFSLWHYQRTGGSK